MYADIPNSPWILNSFYIVLSQKEGDVKNVTVQKPEQWKEFISVMNKWANCVRREQKVQGYFRWKDFEDAIEI